MCPQGRMWFFKENDGRAGRERETKPLRQRVLWFRKTPQGGIKRGGGLCYNSCSRDLTSFLWQVSVDSRQDLCRAQMDSNQLYHCLGLRLIRGVTERGLPAPCSLKQRLGLWFKSAHPGRPSVNRDSGCLILLIHPPHYWVVSFLFSVTISLHFLMSFIPAISLDLKESSMSSTTERFARNLKTPTLEWKCKLC